MVDGISSIEQAHSSMQYHMSNSARLSHLRLNLPCSQSQVKLPLFLKVAGESASSGVSFCSDSSGVLGCEPSSLSLDLSEVVAYELLVPSPLDSSEVLVHELLVPSLLDSSRAHTHKSKSKQSVRGGALSLVATMCLCKARGR